MKIAVIGGGPGGLYFSILTKKRLPSCEIHVYEQNDFDDAFGFGVVFSDETLNEFLSYDQESYDLIRKSFAYWDDLDIVRDDERVRIGGNGFCGCSRKTLLLLLQQRCREEGVHLHFNTKKNSLEEFKDWDMVLAADGINSGIRSERAHQFGTQIDLKSNRFVWLGSTKPLDAFTYFFKSTPHGAFCAHTYQYEKGHSTWVIECSNQTFLNAGFGVDDEAGTIKLIEEIYKDELDGHRLIGNKSHWRQFPHIVNENWHTDNIVILGDAKATAHYSIGSGTKLAMDCAIGLSDAVVAHPDNIQQSFRKYDELRRAPVEMIQHAALVSLNWFEAMDRHMKLDFSSFTFSVMSRSKKITIENQSRRDPEYAENIIRSFNKNTGTTDLDTPPAFTTFQLGPLALKNRIVMSPMGQYCAKDGLADDWHFVHYSSRALGGVGLIITEMTAIAPEGRITPHCPGIWNIEQVDAWKKITDFIHKNSRTKIGIQLGHSGRKGSCDSIKKGKLKPLACEPWGLVSASPIPWEDDFQVPRELDEKGMDKVVSQFKEAAQNAMKAGFDLVELQAHHGFLLASFISPLTNKRTDEFGGSIENRMKFPLRVLKEISSVTKGKAALSVRISATDWAEGGITPEDTIHVARAFKDAGADIINVSTGNTVPEQKPLMGRMWQTPFSEAIKSTLDVPVITTGQIQNIDQINTVLLNRRADLVALGKPFLLDPYFVQTALAYEQYEKDLDIPQQYEDGKVHLFPYWKKQRNEYDEMKICLKPKSNQSTEQ